MPRFGRLRALTVGVALAMLVGLSSLDYTVERGDTLGKIARQHGVSIADLVEANGISNPNLIRIGQVLVIPGEQGAPTLIHVVVRGDTLGRIASRYGTTVSSLVDSNQISNPNLIRLGQEINVPGAHSLPAVVADESDGGADPGDTSGEAAPVEADHSAPPSSTVRSGRYHIVQPGESLGAIASLYSGVSSEQIARANGLIGGTIYAQTRLFLDGPEFIGRTIEGHRTYVVKRGDRLGDIAAAHDTTISALVDTNGISNPNLIVAGQTLSVPGSSTWSCPVVNARFFNDWGFPRGGGDRFHEGNDLFTDHGAPTYAPVSGVVKFKQGDVGGNQFNLYGDDGVVYIGSHMSAFGKDGRVQAGDIVGYIGNTGSAAGTRPHLHFGMYLEGGVVINPYPTLVANGC